MKSNDNKSIKKTELIVPLCGNGFVLLCDMSVLIVLLLCGGKKGGVDGR